MKRAWSFAVAAAAITGVAWSIAAYVADERSRIPASQFTQEFTINLRRPDIVSSLRYAPSGDFASDLVADSTLRDVVIPVKLRDLTPRMRAAWLDAVARYDDQMSRASGLMLDAIRERPGWPYHQSLLGQLVYTRDARRLSPDLVRRYQQWEVPLSAAATSAETDDSLWQSLALAYLQTWPDLHIVHERAAPAVLRRAFADADFVGSAFGNVIEILGGERAVNVLPDRAAPLREAFLHVARTGDLNLAWQISQRWERAEMREQAIDAGDIERIATREVPSQVALRCRIWVAHHADSLFAASSMPAATRVLQLWPADDSKEEDTLRRLVAGNRDLRCNPTSPSMNSISIRSQEDRTICGGVPLTLSLECSNSEIVELRQNDWILRRIMCAAGDRPSFPVASARAAYMLSSRVLARAKAGA